MFPFQFFKSPIGDIVKYFLVLTAAEKAVRQRKIIIEAHVPRVLDETSIIIICQTEQIAVEPSTSSGEQIAPTINERTLNL